MGHPAVLSSLPGVFGGQRSRPLQPCPDMDSLKGSGQEDERNLPPLRVLGDLGAQFLPVVRGPADVQNDEVRTGDLSIGALLSQKREGLYAIADRVDPEGGRKG